MCSDDHLQAIDWTRAIRNIDVPAKWHGTSEKHDLRGRTRALPQRTRSSGRPWYVAVHAFEPCEARREQPRVFRPRCMARLAERMTVIEFHTAAVV